MEFYSPDVLRKAVEAGSGGRETVLYDDLGNPSIFVIIPGGNIEAFSGIEAGLGATSTGVHPAFIKGEQVRNEIFIGKYESIVVNNRAVSVPGVNPSYVNFDNALLYCRNKGPGFHLMTYSEKAYLNLWCRQNGFVPKGNTAQGKDYISPYQTGRIADEANITLTGSGPAAWRHDGTFQGISDLVGNLQEWLAGLRLHNGQINVIENNNAADLFCDMSDAHSNWKAIDCGDGILVPPASANTAYFDCTPSLIVKPVRTTSGAWVMTPFQNITTDDVDGPCVNLLKTLSLIPTSIADSARWSGTNSSTYRMARTTPGNNWGVSAGICGLDFTKDRTYTSGFRVCYITP